MNLRQRAATALSFLLLAAAPGAVYQPYMAPHQLVDVGNKRRLNLYCTGSGSPTVILDTDSDDSSLSWRFVQPAVARLTRVCSYDAAGLGFSDPAPAPRDASAYANDLKELLTRAHIAGPYVLVGYGFSGLSDRLYVDRYPRDVAGIVFVDPDVPYRNQRFASIVSALKPMTDDTSFIASLRTCERAAASHQLEDGSKAFKTCMWPTGPGDTSLPLQIRHVLQDQWRRPGAWNDLIYRAEFDNRSSSEVQQVQRSFGNIPLIVLTSDVRVDLNGMPISAVQLRTLATAYEAWHRDIAHLSTQGTELVVNGSTDNMAVDHPAAVISAIEEVLKRVHDR